MCCPDYAITATDRGLAMCCLILNIFFPGTGTIVNACVGDHPVSGIIFGILQMFTVVFLFAGWIWSIVYGVQILNKSHLYEDMQEAKHNQHHQHNGAY